MATKDQLVACLQAAGGGALVREYDQWADMRIDHQARAGIFCLGICAHWLRLRMGGGDFWTWFESSAGEHACRSVMVSQYMTPGQDRWQAGDRALRSFGLSRLGGQRRGRAPNSTDVAREVLALPGRYALVVLALPGGGGHAMAVATAGVELSLLDPNAGEFAFSSAESFLRWLKLHFDLFGYDRMLSMSVDKYA